MRERRPAPSSRKQQSMPVEDVGTEESSDDDASEKRVIQLQRKKLGMTVTEDGGDDEEEDEGVFDLSDGGEGDSDEGEGDDEEDDDDIGHALAQGGRMAKLAKHAKSLGLKLKLATKEDELGDAVEDGGAGGEEEERGGAIMDDPEALQEEETEALRLQRERASKMAASDFGLDDDGDDGGDEESGDGEEEETMGAAAERKATPSTPSRGAAKAAAAAAAAAGSAPAADAAKRGGKGGKRGTSGGVAAAVEVEAVAKDLSGMSTEARMAALMADAPELMSLLQDLTDSLAEVRHRVGPVLAEVKAGKLATAEGLSYLEAKHLLLLHYCQNIVFYLLLKSEGRSVRDHPVITRLVELRTYLEKIRPIDKQLHYQVEKLLRAAQLADTSAADGGGEDPLLGDGSSPGGTAAGTGSAVDEDAEMLRHGPRPDALIPQSGGAGACRAGCLALTAGRPTSHRRSNVVLSGPGTRPSDIDKRGAAAGGGGGSSSAPSDGLYRPPRLNAASMEMDAEAANVAKVGKDGSSLTRDERRRLKDARSRASRSSAVQELEEELAGAPQELKEHQAGFDSMGAIRSRQQLESRAEAEEELFTRVPLSREENKRLKASRRAGLAGAGAMDDFADEVADLVEVARGQEGQGAGGRASSALTSIFAKQKVSQKYGADHPSLSRKGASGDEDLPKREALGDRRAKFDQTAARRSVAAQQAREEDGGEEYDADGGAGRKRRAPAGEEDAYYQEAKAAATSRKAIRQGLHSAPATLPPLPYERVEEGAPRAIGNTIQKNRGLTPHRRKDLKNPRVKHRIKYASALVRRGGQVQAVRGAEGVSYGGEATGIKSKLSKSKRLG
ncbi:MAG: hypothetical protein WDW36_001185 [Sanguina aurantia]